MRLAVKRDVPGRAHERLSRPPARSTDAVPSGRVTAAIDPSELYARGVATLVAAWEAYARGSRDASVRHDAGATSAVFPHEPERSILNNAVLDRHLPRGARA